MGFGLSLRKKQKNTPKGRGRSWLGFFWETLAGVVFTAAIVSAIGLGLLIWGWSQRDQFLTAEIRKAMLNQFPNAEVKFDAAEFDQRGRILLTNLSFASRADSETIFSVPGIRITVDQDLMLNERKVDIQSIELNRPELTLIHSRDGHWNWEGLFEAEGKEAALPIVRIRDAIVILQYEHEQFSRAVRLKIDAIDTDLIPASMHEYRFSGVGREETLGASQFFGSFDIKHQTWDLSGELNHLKIDQPLLEVASIISPDAKSMVAQLQSTRSSRDAEANLQVAQVSATSHKTFIEGTPADAQVSLELTTDVQFHSSKKANSEPDFSVFAQLVSGQLSHPDLPVPLDQIKGSLAVDKLGLRIDNIVLGSGTTSARLAGAWGWGLDSLPEHVDEGIGFTLNNYRVTPATREFLPSGLKKVYDELTPAGLLSGQFRIRRGIDKPVDFDLVKATVREGTAVHEMFKYPVSEISGEITRTDDGTGKETWALEFDGRAASRPVKISGTLIDPGTDYETVIDIHTDKFPIDNQFYRALSPRQSEVMTHIGIQGTADVHCVVLRRQAHGPKPIVRLAIDVYDSSMRLKSFPLPVRDLSGHIAFDENGWQVSRVKGRHGETPVHAYGTVKEVGNDDWKLELTMMAEQARFDHNLYLAISESDKKSAQVWELLRPRGLFDINLKIDWTTGQQVEVDVPLMKLKNCEINPTVMPWRLMDLEGTVTVNREHTVAFENLKARHDQCVIETSGSFIPRKDFWQLRFDQIDADDLTPSHEFMAAIPKNLRDLLVSVKLKDPVSLSGQVEFKGDYAGRTITAAWDSRAVLNQTDLYLGVDVNDVSGTISCQGYLNRDGVAIVPTGKLSIDSCWVMGYHVTEIHGPFQLSEKKMVIGSPKMFDSEDAGNEWSTVSREERVTGRIFDGELFLDLLVQRTPTTPYLLRTTLSRANLEQWAIQSNYGQANIRGEVNGYIDLAGDSVSSRATVGNGRLLISPAALYEVPVLFQMFQSLRFAPADDTAFRHAYAEFRVLDEKFVFDEIGLLGDTMSLFGQGYVRFDRTIDLDFVYRPPRRGGINLASQLMNRLENVLPVLFTVEVDGTVDVPRIAVNDGMRETLRGFGRMLQQAPGNIRPPKIMPPPRIQQPPRTAELPPAP
ncbi:hypothetical protein [Rubinisphaera sp.]|uniref:hypothetical protein n=1 Tax=Rubinisphaera sp. TaxID=2024857 RepID=UPI000C0E49BB|nr:hypothetical protein [Rubinisphaera sp.]MBV08077.1 hypothetical protein [Rubinisphaera sp.]